MTHNLKDLEDQLSQSCNEILPATPFPIRRLQPFAVEFRYDSSAKLSEVQRNEIRETVAMLRDHIVERILQVEQALRP